MMKRNLREHFYKYPTTQFPIFSNSYMDALEHVTGEVEDLIYILLTHIRNEVEYPDK